MLYSDTRNWNLSTVIMLINIVYLDGFGPNLFDTIKQGRTQMFLCILQDQVKALLAEIRNLNMQTPTPGQKKTQAKIGSRLDSEKT